MQISADQAVSPYQENILSTEQRASPESRQQHFPSVGQQASKHEVKQLQFVTL